MVFLVILALSSHALGALFVAQRSTLPRAPRPARTGCAMVLIQVAKGPMLQPAVSGSVLGPASALCARHLFIQSPPNQAAEASLAREIYSNLIGRYGAANKKQNALVVAQEGRELLGACGVNVEKQPGFAGDESVPVLANLVVDPSVRRRGIARKLVQACEDEVRGWGFRKLFLKVEEPNAAARKLYEKLGYRTIMIDRDSQIPTGTSMFNRVQWVPANLVVMEKDLAPIRIPFLDFL